MPPSPTHPSFFFSSGSRFEEGLVTDLVAFLRESWAVAVFHDEFPALVDDIKADLIHNDAIATAASGMSLMLRQGYQLDDTEVRL